MFLVESQRDHLGLQQHLADIGRQVVDEFLDEVDLGLVELLVREVDLPEGIEIGNLPEYCIVVGVEIVHQDLAEIAPVFLLFRFLDLEGLLKGLVIDDPFLQESEPDLVGDVDVRHGTVTRCWGMAKCLSGHRFLHNRDGRLAHRRVFRPHRRRLRGNKGQCRQHDHDDHRDPELDEIDGVPHLV